jgi:hypothetical protein
MIPGHPNTVRSSPIPLYMQGLHLGQDLEPSMYDPSLDLVPPAPDTSFLPSIPAVTPIDTISEIAPGGSLISPFTPPSPAAAPAMQPALTPAQLTQLYQSAGAAGTMTPAQINSAIAQLTAGAGAVATAASGAAPKVAVPAVAAMPTNVLTAASFIPGVPNYLVIAAAAFAFIVMDYAGKK